MKILPTLSTAVAIAALSSTASAAIGGPACLPEFAAHPGNYSSLPGYRAPAFRPGYQPYGYRGLRHGAPAYMPGFAPGFVPSGYTPVPAPVMPMMPAPTLANLPGMGGFPGGFGGYPDGPAPWGGAPFNGPFNDAPFDDIAPWDPINWGGTPWGSAPWGIPYPGYAVAAPAISPVEDDQAIIGTESSTPPGPVDTDQDGVFDSADLCADTAPTAKVDGLGCSLDANIVLEGVNFHTDSAKLTDASTAILDGVAKTLTANPDVKVEVAGHTDSDAADDYNLKLSHARAEAVVSYLAAHGVQADHMTAKGYGESQPLVANDSPANKAINRRVELRRL